MTPKWALSLRGFGVAFGDQVVLASIDLDVPPTGLVFLVGEAGAGKSTLLRTLAGLNDAQPGLRTWGEALLNGEPLGPRRPALVQQKARLLTATVRENLVSALPDRGQLTKPEQTETVVTELRRVGLGDLVERLHEPVVGLTLVEQRMLSIVRASLTDAPVILIDEPTAQLDDEGKAQLANLIDHLTSQRVVVVVTHNRGLAKKMGGRISLLAGGRIQESRRSQSFFDHPATESARSFIRTGRCALPSPMARPEDLSPSRPPPPALPPAARAAVSGWVGPQGFHWVLPGALGGLPRPGIVRDLEHDLQGLQRLGVTRLITLEEDETVPMAPLEEHAVAGFHFPIVDMCAPELEAARSLCERVDAWIDAGEVVAMHCRAGLGRTGTLLTAHLIWRGSSALEALERARAINPRWVQSDEQVTFLSHFERWLATARDEGGTAQRDS